MKSLTATFTLLTFLIIIFSCQKEKLPIVITTPITEVTNLFAIAGGEVIDEGDSPVIKRGICYTTDENETPIINNVGTLSTTEGSGLGSFTSKIDAQWFGASHRYSKNHYLRAYATNTAGTSYGELLSFIPKLHPPSFSSMSLIGVTTTTAIINYMLNLDNTYDEIDICINTNPNPTIEGNHYLVQRISIGSNDTIKNLVPNTTYYVRVYAKNESGFAYSPEISFTTWEGTITDVIGNVYPIKTIGSQVWMIKNLKTSKFSDGNIIPNIQDNLIWSSIESSASCTYTYSNHEQLYNYYAVADNRNLCPSGWHVPTDNEWKIMEIYLGMNQDNADATGYRGSDEGGKLKLSIPNYIWKVPNTGATNSSGFSAPGGGFRYENGIFTNTTMTAHYWTSSVFDSNSAWSRSLSYDNAQVGRLNINKKYGFSVRCVKD